MSIPNTPNPPSRLSARNERIKKEWEDSLDGLLDRTTALEVLDNSNQLFKKWGIAGYLRVSMNEGDVKELDENLKSLERQREKLSSQLEPGKLPSSIFTDEERKQYSSTLEGLTDRITRLKKTVDGQLKSFDKSEEAKKKAEEQAKQLEAYKKQLEEKRARINDRSRVILAEIQARRKKEYQDRYESGITNVMRAKAESDPLSDDEAQRLERKQAVFDEIRLQQQLAEEGEVALGDSSPGGILSLIKGGAIAGKRTGERYGKALIQGASELASELFWTSINTSMIFFSWPLALPIKGVNYWVLRPISKALNGISGGLDEGILKGAIPAWRDFVTTPSEKGGSNIVLRGAAAVFGAPLAFVGGAVSYAAKGLSYGAEKLYKNFNWDNMMRTPGGLVAGGLLGGGVGIAITIALLVAAPFTFGITAGILAGLWIGIGASAAVGVAKGIKNAKDAGKAEINLELSEEDSNRLMEWKHRHGGYKKDDIESENIVRKNVDQKQHKDIGKTLGKTIDTLALEKGKYGSEISNLSESSASARPSITTAADRKKSIDVAKDVKDDKDVKERTSAEHDVKDSHDRHDKHERKHSHDRKGPKTT